MTLLTKSKYLVGLQCPKYFWVSLHEEDRIPEPDLSTQHKFDQGHIVGQLAKGLFPDGIDIPEADFKKNIAKSKEFVKLGKPLFEAAFMVGNLYSRADILVPAGSKWDIIEVKSGTKVKDVNIQDVSFQKHVYSLAGLNIRKCFLMHVNNEFVKSGEIDPKKFFTKEDITEEVNEAIVGIEERINNLLNVMKSETCPDVKISKDCSDPYDCPLEDDCWGFLPSASIFDLYRGGQKCFKLLEEGILALKDIPHEYKLTDKQGIQHKCEKTGKVHVDKEKLKKFLEGIQKPVYYLDFETFRTAIPILDGTKPYQQIPFQFSLHIDGKHFEFLANDNSDPREKFLVELRTVLGSSGSIIVYNQSFEISRLKELADAYPDYKKWVSEVIDRVVDLWFPFKNFYYYNSEQHGSASIKDVLPAITEKDYSKLKIADGDTAALSYLSMIYADGEDVRKDLLKYCKLDTEAMVWIVKELGKIVK
ncbi:MAG: DUF2779 domain-containing protein [Nanoarchaeota archaeon]|nr:DUF2779 domain-containing protein [Nanoarchaeota archaeon]MBU1632819.1 DUF2779 domain-containing protein [Nanoarchaeota archaeon]MBU1876488.1 DUF2779 domain-containing protein [Nanoarchaeota archaeon]